MIKLVVGLFAIAIFPYLCESAVVIYPEQDKPPEFASQDGCYLEKLNRVIGYGETFYNVGRECASYKCQDSGDTIQYTCGVVDATGLPGCRVVEGDLSLKYPDCCPTIKCRKIKGPIIINPTDRPPIM